VMMTYQRLNIKHYWCGLNFNHFLITYSSIRVSKNNFAIKMILNIRLTFKKTHNTYLD